MQALKDIKEAYNNLDNADPLRVKGIIKDYLPYSRDLKNDLLIAVDLGVVDKIALHKKCPSHLKEVLRNKMCDKRKVEKLIHICLYITGHKNINPAEVYSQPLSVPESNQCKQAKSNIKPKQTISPKSNPINKDYLGAWKYSLVALFILVLTVVVVLKNWKPSLNNKIEKTHRAEGVLVRNTINNRSIQGYYLGIIKHDKIKKKYVLIVDGSGDSINCTLMDYPFYNDPKQNFVLNKVGEKTFKSSMGSFYFTNDSLISLPQSTSDNPSKWIFAKKN